MTTETGDFTITFTNPRSSANYIVNCQIAETGGNRSYKTYVGSQTTNSFNVIIGQDDNGTSQDTPTDINFYFTVIDW